MGQFTVHENPNPSSKKAYPFMIDVQSPLLDGLETRLVIPLALKTVFGNKPIAGLNPTVDILGEEYFVLTQQMAAVHRVQLGRPVADCTEKRHEMLAAIDLLITGF